jgi:hypothetical protein
MLINLPSGTAIITIISVSVVDDADVRRSRAGLCRLSHDNYVTES